MIKSIFLIIFCFSFVTCSQQKVNSVSDFRYEEINEGIMITRYIGETKNVIIPESINEKPIISIGNHAFQDQQLTSITMPESIRFIGMFSFANNQLKNIKLPRSLSHIASGAFDNNQIKNISLPNFLVNINWNAFDNNPLVSITFPDNIILNGAFFISVYNKYVNNGSVQSTFNIQLTSYNYFKILILDNSVVEILEYSGNANIIEIPENINELPVIAIGSAVFWNKNLSNITFPRNLTHIGDGSFINNQLTNIILPDSLIHIGGQAFVNNKLTRIVIPNSVIELAENAFDNNVEIIRN